MKKNIALIDDDEGPILYYQMALEDAGFRVTRLRTFREAYTFIEHPDPSPDFWVIDVMMSVGDGSLIEGGVDVAQKTNMGLGAGLLLYEKIKKIDPNIPAVLLTSISTPDLLNDIEKALINGDACESKLDVLPDNLVEMIQKRL